MKRILFALLFSLAALPAANSDEFSDDADEKTLELELNDQGPVIDLFVSDEPAPEEAPPAAVRERSPAPQAAASPSKVAARDVTKRLPEAQPKRMRHELIQNELDQMDLDALGGDE